METEPTSWANAWGFISWYSALGISLAGAFFVVFLFLGFKARQGRNGLKNKVSE